MASSAGQAALGEVAHSGRSEVTTQSVTWAWRSESYAWFVVVLLTAAFTFSMIDRMILTLMIEPIKRDLGVSDTEVSLLHGLAFTLLYVLCGFPLGWIADRKSRRGLAGISIFFWSFMTALCGMASSFWQLFLARVGVGVGEAGLSPAAASLISDYFPRDKLARPTAFFSVGGSAGTGLAFIFGGAVIQLVSDLGPLHVPVLGEIYAWQATFFVVGVPGILFALLFRAVREPARRGCVCVGSEVASVGDVVRFLRRDAQFFSSHFLGASLAAMVIIGLHSWMPTYFIRTHGWTAEQAGYVYGATVLIAGVSGLLSAGLWVERLTATGMTDAHLHVALRAALLGCLPATLAPLLPYPWMTVVTMAVAIFLIVIPIALAPVALQIVVPNQMRGQVFAAYLFVLSILGYGTGPTVVALATDFLFQAESLIRFSLSLVAVSGLPLAACFISRARRSMPPPVDMHLSEGDRS